jgi:hypothetical protein
MAARFERQLVTPENNLIKLSDLNPVVVQLKHVP